MCFCSFCRRWSAMSLPLAYAEPSDALNHMVNTRLYRICEAQ